MFCAISRPLLSIAAAGSPVVGADPSSTTSSCEVEEDVELIEEDVDTEVREDEGAVETVEEDVDVTDDVVVVLELVASTTPAAAMIMIMTTITAITVLEIALTFLLIVIIISCVKCGLFILSIIWPNRIKKNILFFMKYSQLRAFKKIGCASERQQHD